MTDIKFINVAQNNDPFEGYFNDNLSAIISASFNILLPVLVFSSAIGVIITILSVLLFNISGKKDIGWVFLLLYSYNILGTFLGLFIGFSQQPVVGSILPPIITLISGIIAYLTTKDISSFFRYISPLLVIVFVCGTVVGAFYGANLKTLLS